MLIALIVSGVVHLLGFWILSLVLYRAAAIHASNLRLLSLLEQLSANSEQFVGALGQIYHLLVSGPQPGQANQPGNVIRFPGQCHEPEPVG